MNPGVVVLLVLITLAWALLPLVPALREFFRPTDVEPLTMVGRDNADIARFARVFREYLKGQLDRFPSGQPGATDLSGTFPDGTPFLRPAQVPNELTRTGIPGGGGTRLVLLDQSTVLDNGERFELELWAKHDVFGSPGATYRAVLGERNVELGEGSVVLRWLHSVGMLVVGPGSHLFGRTSAEEAIQLARGVTFERLGAPVISVGVVPARTMPPRHTEPASFQPPPGSRRLGDHLRIEGDLTVPEGTLVEANLVVAGNLTLARGSRIVGSLKVHRELRTQAGVVVEGALVSRGPILLGQDCWVSGPVISEDRVEIGRGTSVGGRTRPSTVAAREIHLADGVTVSGQIVTTEGGLTAG